MKSKIWIPVIATLFLLIMGLYFLFNPSYEKSLRAKYYYETGSYHEALVLAKDAFSLDMYNRMASTIIAQSITSLKYVSYNDEAKKYMDAINEMASNEVISDADKAKIRTMCSIMIGSYPNLAPSVITDKVLVATAAKYYTDFKVLLEKVNK